MKSAVITLIVVVVVASALVALKRYGWLATKSSTSDMWGANCQLVVNGESKNGKYYHGTCTEI